MSMSVPRRLPTPFSFFKAFNSKFECSFAMQVRFYFSHSLQVKRTGSLRADKVKGSGVPWLLDSQTDCPSVCDSKIRQFFNIETYSLFTG